METVVVPIYQGRRGVGYIGSGGVSATKEGDSLSDWIWVQGVLLCQWTPASFILQITCVSLLVGYICGRSGTCRVREENNMLCSC